MEHEENTDNFLEYFVEGAKKLGFSFDESILEKFHLYYKELSFWNRSVNLTGLHTEQEQAVLLFADSLAGSLSFPEHSFAFDCRHRYRRRISRNSPQIVFSFFAGHLNGATWQ